MKAWSHHLPGLFTPDECRAISDYALSRPGHDALVLNHGQYVVEPTMRRSEVRWLDRGDAALSQVFYQLQTAGERVNATVFGFDLRTLPKLQFAEYHGAAQGHFDWHIDNNWTADEPMGRKLTAVVMLSAPEDFEGGVFELNHGAPKLAQGDVVFFPAFHRHRVTPVTAGVRRTLAAWWHGPAFR